MDDSASVTTLATAEKKPGRTGGCVGIFFQLFDWNRRFAKKKLFSKRLLPPDRSKEASKKFGGDEKLPKLRLIADENSGGFPNMNKNGASNVNNIVSKSGVQTPSLVARLMGLDSMPSVHRDKLLKDSSGEIRVGRREKVVEETTKQEFRPQKLQKTGIIERRTVTRFGAEALQLKNVLSRSRKHHYHHPKLATPVKNTSNHTKRNTSRLIGAATRILEPGLQARNKSKYAIMKSGNLELSNGQTSCKNCGNLLDSTSSFDQEHVTNTIPFEQSQPQKFASPIYFNDNNRRPIDDSVTSQSKSNCLPFNAVSNTKNFVDLNKNLSGRTRSRVSAKIEDTKFDIGGNNYSSPGHKRHLPHIKKRGEIRTVSSAASTGGNKNNDEIGFRFNSTMKNRCEVPIKVERRRNPNLQKKPLHLTDDSLGGLLEEKLHELTSQIKYESGINATKRTSARIFQELICALNMERTLPQNQCSHGYDHNASFYLQKKTGALTSGRNNDHLSPGSVLEASFSNDSCCSSSFEDSSVRTHRFQDSETDPFFSDPFYSDVSLTKVNTRNKLVTDLITYISQVLSTIDIINNSRIKQNTCAHIKEVIFNSELVLTNQTPHNPNEFNSFFVCDLLLQLDTLVDIISTRFGNFLGSKNTRFQLKRFVFDALIEYLDSKYEKYSKCGFRIWENVPIFMGFEVLICEIVEEVRRWTVFVGGTADEFVEQDMNRGLGKWTGFEIELYETGARIEWEIVEMLVDEIVEFLTCGVLRV